MPLDRGIRNLLPSSVDTPNVAIQFYDIYTNVVRHRMI